MSGKSGSEEPPLGHATCWNYSFSFDYAFSPCIHSPQCTFAAFGGIADAARAL